jgi:hypothetical protein
VSIWIHEGYLHIEYQQAILAQYHCQADRRHYETLSARRAAACGQGDAARPGRD